MSLLFVYGSLKEGFPNFHVNQGRRVAGDYGTAVPHPLWLYDGQLPCLLPADGSGHVVQGQLFEVGPAELAAMDALERVGEPGGYRRIEIDIVRQDTAPAQTLRAWVYVQDPALLAGPGTHVGPLAAYTAEHAQRLRW